MEVADINEIKVVNDNDDEKNVKVKKTDNPDYMKNYMRDYIKNNNEMIICNVCGGRYKKYNKYAHDTKTKKHLFIINKIKQT